MEFKEIYNEYFKKIYKLCLYKTQDLILAEDLTQDIFIKVYKALPSFKGKSSIYTFIYTIAVRTIYGRKTESNVIYIEGIQVAIDSMEENTELRERNRRIYEIIQGFEEKYKLALYFHYYEDLKVKEIAQIMKKNESTIKTWLCRGRYYLKLELEKEGISYE